MKKRVGLARAMIHDPKVLMCDEPSAGLDPVTSASLDELILQLKATFGLTIIVVTHELDSIRRIADNVVMVGKGRVHFAGTARAFFDSQDPEIRAYLERRAVWRALGVRRCRKRRQGAIAAGANSLGAEFLEADHQLRVFSSAEERARLAVGRNVEYAVPLAGRRHGIVDAHVVGGPLDSSLEDDGPFVRGRECSEEIVGKKQPDVRPGLCGRVTRGWWAEVVEFLVRIQGREGRRGDPFRWRW